MPNPIKYTTGSESLALKKGNFYIGTGDVGKGPSNVTGFYQGVSPSAGGYVIYMNKSGAPGDLSYHNAANDSELISFTNNLAGQSFTSATQCLVYYAGQTDKVCLNIDYPAISTNGLVLNLDAGFTPSYPTSGTSWYDLGPSGNTGTLTNGPTYSGGSIVFDGSDDFVSLGNQQSLQFTDNFSAFIWIKPTSQQFQKGVIGNATYNNGGWMIALANNFFKPIIVINSQTEQGVLGNTTIISNNWYNIGFTFSSGVLTLYLNGLVDNTGSGLSITKNTTTFVIGKGSQGGWGSFLGLLSSSQVYDRVLTNSEILQNYRVGYFKTQNIVTNGLILYLDAGVKVSYPTTGTTWYDMSGNNLNGTLTNGPTYSSDGGGSIVFDGTDDYISIVLPSPISVSSFSYNVWFNADSVTGAYRTIIDLNNDNFLITIVPEGTLAMWSPTYNTGYAVNTGQWYNIQVTHEYGQPYYWYINGSLIFTYSGITTTTHTVCNIGIGAGFHTCSGRGPDEFFDGKIPIASMYNRELSATEVLQNFNAQKGRFGL